MDANELPPFPHLSWLTYGLVIQSPRVFLLHEFRSVAHRLIASAESDADFLWTTGGADVSWHVTSGSLGFFPCDFARHALAITTGGGCQGYALLVPAKHLEVVCAAEGVGQAVDLCSATVFRDPHLLACMLRLVVGYPEGNVEGDVGSEIAARQVIMRLAVISGRRPPDWVKDTSVFTPTVLARIVERLDTHLAARPSLEDVSRGFGLSPSHFARKFRSSTGVSLSRFMNRRRIGLSLALLKRGGRPLAQLSLDLGFCSQSHFTRLFSDLMGLSPHQFRLAQRRMVD